MTVTDDAAARPQLLNATATDMVLHAIRQERKRQDADWGQQNHPDGTGDDRVLLGDVRFPTYGMLSDLHRHLVDGLATAGRCEWALILLEEVFEALAVDDPKLLRRELVKVAAVAAGWVEAVDRRLSGMAT